MLVFNTTARGFVRKPRPVYAKFTAALQAHVGGNVEEVPHKQKADAPWVAYVNDDGAAKHLPLNPLAYHVLQGLGFEPSDNLGYYFGNVVLLGRDEAALTVRDVALVKEAQDRYIAGLAESSEEDNDYAPDQEDESSSSSSASSSSSEDSSSSFSEPPPLPPKKRKSKAPLVSKKPAKKQRKADE